MGHFADANEADLARQISDVQNDRWLLAKAGKGSIWSASFKYPANSKSALSSSSKIPQSTRDLIVKPSPFVSIVMLIPGVA